MNNYCVYVHKNKENGKQYCGITCQKPENRWRNGSGYHNNKHFENAINKYGWDGFEHIIICSGLNKNEADKTEKEYIFEHNLMDPEYGYNQTEGGDGTCGYIHSEETRLKMSLSRIGHICSDDTKRKISDKNSGSKNGMYLSTPWNKGLAMPQQIRDKVSKSRQGKASGENHPMFGKKHTKESLGKCHALTRGIRRGTKERKAL